MVNRRHYTPDLALAPPSAAGIAVAAVDTVAEAVDTAAEAVVADGYR